MTEQSGTNGQEYCDVTFLNTSVAVIQLIDLSVHELCFYWNISSYSAQKLSFKQ